MFEYLGVKMKKGEHPVDYMYRFFMETGKKHIYVTEEELKKYFHPTEMIVFENPKATTLNTRIMSVMTVVKRDENLA